MNVKAWLEFELPYYDIAVKYVCCYDTGTTPALVKSNLIRLFYIYNLVPAFSLWVGYNTLTVCLVKR